MHLREPRDRAARRVYVLDELVGVEIEVVVLVMVFVGAVTVLEVVTVLVGTELLLDVVVTVFVVAEWWLELDFELLLLRVRA